MEPAVGAVDLQMHHDEVSSRAVLHRVRGMKTYGHIARNMEQKVGKMQTSTGEDANSCKQLQNDEEGCRSVQT